MRPCATPNCNGIACLGAYCDDCQELINEDRAERRGMEVDDEDSE